MKRIIKKNDGQVLVEILASFVLLTFLLAGLVVAGLFALRNAQYARNKSTATKLASQLLERTRVYRDVNGISSLSGCNPCYIDSSLTKNSGVYTSGIFTEQLRINADDSQCPLPGGSSYGYKAISTVSWDTSNPNKNVTINTCFSDWK